MQGKAIGAGAARRGGRKPVQLRAENGQTMAEHGVVLALLVVVTMVAFIALGSATSGLISKVAALI